MSETKHDCRHTSYRCQYEDEQVRLCCAFAGVLDERPDLCPVCGEPAMPYRGRTTDGRIIGACGDAFEHPNAAH